MTVDVPYSLYGGVRECVFSRERECMLAGGAETGKTLGLLWLFDALAKKYPGAQLSIIRKVRADLLPSVLRTYKRDFLDRGYCPGVTAYGGENPAWYDYPGGSRIWLGGMDDPGRTLSAERDAIMVNQAEQLSLTDWEYLTRCVTGRGAVMPYTRLVGDCNPAHRSHWILRRAAAGSLTLYNSTHRDNPVLWDHARNEWTEQGLRTREALGKLTGDRYMRLFQGVWANPEGAIFQVFDEAKHKVKAFDPPAAWPRAVGVDPVGAFVAALWAAFDPRGRVLHVYREYMEPFGLTTRQHAANILALSKGEAVFGWYGGGPSERQQRTDFQEAGVPIVAPEIADVWSGIDKINELLATGALVIHDNCINLLSQLGSYRRKLDRAGNPTEAIEDKETYHLVDNLRYIVAGLTGGERSQVVYDPVRVSAW